jgi:hypothetical protein
MSRWKQVLMLATVWGGLTSLVVACIIGNEYTTARNKKEAALMESRIVCPFDREPMKGDGFESVNGTTTPKFKCAAGHVILVQKDH